MYSRTQTGELLPQLRHMTCELTDPHAPLLCLPCAVPPAGDVPACNTVHLSKVFSLLCLLAGSQGFVVHTNDKNYHDQYQAHRVDCVYIVPDIAASALGCVSSKQTHKTGICTPI